MKNVAFLTGTRADYGKLKGLIKVLNVDVNYKVSILVTGMHLLPQYGSTVNEILSDDLGEIHLLPNQHGEQLMEISVARTIEQLSSFFDTNPVDLLIVHGDRLEALAGSLTGLLRNIAVGHIEGGEISGTVDGILRHSVSKLSHIHFVANNEAATRIRQLGESPQSIHVIGSPDIDIMFSDNLPQLRDVVDRYCIPFKEFAIAIFHPVTNEIESMRDQAVQFANALIESGRNFILIKSNNDLGSEVINSVFNSELNTINILKLPSMRFEFFLTLLKNAKFIVGNSSAGIREAPYYGVPTINVGSRQNGRSLDEFIINVPTLTTLILEGMEKAERSKHEPRFNYGDGFSAFKFKEILDNFTNWPPNIAKEFVDFEEN
jgi:UDP-N-acetylglucosamine 2-epimerase (hydrolysing)